jgi:hypothetical protein
LFASDAQCSRRNEAIWQWDDFLSLVQYKRATGDLSLRGGPHLFAFPEESEAGANA